MPPTLRWLEMRLGMHLSPMVWTQVLTVQNQNPA
jgi:hypothetical protein